MMTPTRIRRRVLVALAVTSCAVPVLAGRPVARWDVVPDQCFTGVFNAGVCAFHTAGVKVEFRVGDAWAHTATAPTLNDRTGVWEFVCPLDAARHADGPITVRARAVPLNGTDPAYDLPNLPLFANPGGSLTVGTVTWVDAVEGSDTNAGTRAAPYATLARAVARTPGGGTINLLKGRYSSAALGGGSKRPYWTTIQAAPDVARDDVEIGPGRPGTDRLRWHNVTLFCDATNGYATILTGENGTHSVWLDNCKVYNKKGRWAAQANTFGNRYVAYITGGLTTQMHNGPEASLIRGHTLRDITSDAWTGSEKLVVNCVCDGIDRGPTPAHPDFHQSHAVAPGWVENVILYNVRGLRCNCQGLFGLRLRHSAFVNVLFEKGDAIMVSQYSGPMENVMFLHLTLVNQPWRWRSGYTPTDVRVVNGIFPSMQAVDGVDNPGLRVDHCHFGSSSQGMGADRTTGDPRFRSPDRKDYGLNPASPAAGTGRPLQCVPADIDGRPFRAGQPHRGCYSDEDKTNNEVSE